MSPRLWLLVIFALAGAFAPSRAAARGAETCAQGFFATATTACPESEPQVAGTHQGFAACGYESASGYSQAAETGAMNPNILSGHGEFLGGELTVPEGTSVTVWTQHGGTISDALGNAIETGGNISIEEFPEIEGARTYLPGSTMPNYTLSPPTGLNIMGNPTMVTTPTQLGNLVGPGMGNVQWAACLYCQ